MIGMVDAMTLRMRIIAQTAAIRTVGAVLMLVGVGFMTVALWIYLTTIGTALFAALVTGGLYFGGGLILVAVAAMRARIPPIYRAAAQTGHPPAMMSPIAQLAEGLAVGLQAGRAMHSAPPNSRGD